MAGPSQRYFAATGSVADNGSGTRFFTAGIAELLNYLSEASPDATPAQIALAWLLAQKPWIVPIPGTRNLDHQTENLGAVNVQLTSADLREIETAFSKIKVHGGRMNEEQMKAVDQTV